MMKPPPEVAGIISGCPHERQGGLLTAAAEIGMGLGQMPPHHRQWLQTLPQNFQGKWLVLLLPPLLHRVRHHDRYQ